MGGHWAAYKTNSNNLWMLFDDTGVDVDDLCRTLLRGFRLCFESCVAQVKPLVSSTVKEKKTKKTTKICTNSAIYWLWTHLRAYIKE